MQPQNNYGYGYGTTGGSGAWGQNQAYYNEMMVPAAPDPTPKKNNRSLIIVAVVLAVVLGLIGVMMLITSSESEAGDPVSNAVYNLMSETAPEYVAVDGKVNFENESSGDFRNAELRIKSSLATKTLINQTVMGVSAYVSGHSDLSLKVTESYNGGDDIFAKIDGIEVSLADWSSTNSNMSSTSNTTPGNNGSEQYSQQYLECLRDMDNTTDCSELQQEAEAEDANSVGLYDLLEGLEAMADMDGKWVRLKTKDITAGLVSTLTIGSMNGQCAVDTVDDWRNNRENLASLYAENPFIYSEPLVADEYGEYEFSSELDEQTVMTMTSSEEEEEGDGTEEEEVVAPTIYQVRISDELLTNFLNAATEAGTLKVLNSCLGLGQSGVEVSQIVEAAQKLPSVFVTLDDNGNLAQIYFTRTSRQNNVTAVGLELSYPESISIQTPKNYLEVNNLLQGRE